MTTKAADDLELPEYRHLPGLNPRPDCSYLESIGNKATPLTADDTAKTNIAWLYGVRLLNAGYYWEAHEVLEAVWINALPNSRERYLLQAIIHLANARLKVHMQRCKAVTRLLGLAMECHARAYPAAAGEFLMGVNRNQLERLLMTASEQEINSGGIELTYHL